MGLIDGKVVLVTGGSRNVGAGIVRCLAREGAVVAVNYLKNADRADEVVKSVQEHGGKAKAWQCDVLDTHAVNSMVADIVQEFGRIDAVVNNARSQGRIEPTDADPVNWAMHDREFEYGVKAVLNTFHAAYPYMKAQSFGRIVNIGSVAWNHPWTGEGAYAAGKAAMLGISRCLIQDVGPEGITINTVAPGWTRTERTPEDINDGPHAKRLPLRRLADPEDVGDVCVFLISDLARYVSGAYIPVDGGNSPQMGG